MEIDSLKTKIVGILLTAIVSGLLMRIGVSPGCAKVGGAVSGVTGEHLVQEPESQPSLANNESSPAYVKTKSGSDLRLRSQPSTTAPVIASMPNGSTVYIIAYEENFTYMDGEKGKWCNIRYNNKTGWAWGGFIIRME